MLRHTESPTSTTMARNLMLTRAMGTGAPMENGTRCTSPPASGPEVGGGCEDRINNA